MLSSMSLSLNCKQSSVSCMHAHVCIHTHKHMCAHMHTHTHAQQTNAFTHSCIPPKGGQRCLMSPPVWNLRSVIWFHFTISCLVCWVLLLFLCHLVFCLLAHFLFGSLLSMKSRKRLIRNLLHTSATHAILVQDITDIDCQTQRGSAHSYVFATLEHWLLTNYTHKSTELQWVHFLLHFYW